MREEGKLGRFGIRSDAREEFDRRVQEAMDGAGPAIQFQSSGEVGALAAALEEMRSRRNPEPVFETSPEPAATPEVVVKESAVAEEAAEKAVAAGQLSLGEVFSRINDGTAERLQRQANEYLHMIARAMSTETQA